MQREKPQLKFPLLSSDLCNIYPDYYSYLSDYKPSRDFYAFGHCWTLRFCVASLHRLEVGHISKQGSRRAVSCSGSGGSTPNLN